MKNAKTQISKCNNCGATVQGLERFDNRTWCPACLEEKTGICEKCENRFCKPELTTFDDQLWCEDCLHEETTTCADCNDRVYSDDATYVGDDPICESCYENNYFYCERCDRSYHNDEYGGDGYCRDCMADGKPAAYPDNRRYYSRSRRDLPVGVEIEAEGGDYRDVYDDLADEGFGVQLDGSLDDDGIEVQVPASNGNNTQKLVQRACQCLEGNGFGVSKRCGLHVHIEYPSQMRTIKRLMLMVYACEPVFYAINPRSRLDSAYCQPLSKRFSVHEIIQTDAQKIDELFYSKKYAGLTRSKVRNFKRMKWNDCRYFGFNLHSLFYQRTVEFRYHAGTSSYQKIMRWIALLKAILLYVRYRYDQAEVLRLIEQPTVLSKINYIKQLLKLDEPLAAYIVNRYIRFHKEYVRDNLC